MVTGGRSWGRARSYSVAISVKVTKARKRRAIRSWRASGSERRGVRNWSFWKVIVIVIGAAGAGLSSHQRDGCLSVTVDVVYHPHRGAAKMSRPLSKGDEALSWEKGDGGGVEQFIGSSVSRPLRETASREEVESTTCRDIDRQLVVGIREASKQQQ